MFSRLFRFIAVALTTPVKVADPYFKPGIECLEGRDLLSFYVPSPPPPPHVLIQTVQSVVPINVTSDELTQTAPGTWRQVSTLTTGTSRTVTSNFTDNAIELDKQETRVTTTVTHVFWDNGQAGAGDVTRTEVRTDTSVLHYTRDYKRTALSDDTETSVVTSATEGRSWQYLAGVYAIYDWKENHGSTSDTDVRVSDNYYVGQTIVKDIHVSGADTNAIAGTVTMSGPVFFFSQSLAQIRDASWQNVGSEYTKISITSMTSKATSDVVTHTLTSGNRNGVLFAGEMVVDTATSDEQSGIGGNFGRSVSDFRDKTITTETGQFWFFATDGNAQIGSFQADHPYSVTVQLAPPVHGYAAAVSSQFSFSGQATGNPSAVVAASDSNRKDSVAPGFSSGEYADTFSFQPYLARLLASGGWGTVYNGPFFPSIA